MAVPSAWPALLALAVVVLLSIGMLATDLIVEHRTAAETTKLVGDALRSVTLADHLRADAHALAATPDPAVAANVAEEIARVTPHCTSLWRPTRVSTRNGRTCRVCSRAFSASR